MLGIANLKKVLALVLECANVADKVRKAEGSGVAKYAALMNLWDEVVAIGGVSFDQVLPEIKDLDDAEQAELYAFLKEKLALEADNAKLEGIIEDMVGVLLEAEALVKRAVAMVEAYKA